MNFPSNETPLSIMEKYRKSSKRLVNDEFVYSNMEILENRENHAIGRFFIEGYDHFYYAIFYKINEEFYYTISTSSAMKNANSILTTRKLLPSVTFVDNLVSKDIYFEDFLEKEALMNYVNTFITFLTQIPLIRLRVQTGNYKWFLQTEGFREEIVFKPKKDDL